MSFLATLGHHCAMFLTFYYDPMLTAPSNSTSPILIRPDWARSPKVTNHIKVFNVKNSKAEYSNRLEIRNRQRPQNHQSNLKNSGKTPIIIRVTQKRHELLKYETKIKHEF